MAPPVDVSTPQAPELGFSVLHQKVELDIDLQGRSIQGRTEITLSPHSKNLKLVRLNCRQCDLEKLQINGKNCPGVTYKDPYKSNVLFWKAGVDQDHVLQQKLEGQRKKSEAELAVVLPKGVKIEDLDPFSNEGQAMLLSRGVENIKSEGSANALDLGQNNRAAADQYGRFAPIQLDIKYEINRVRDGLQFVGWEEGDLRYPHVYSASQTSAGTACCLFPCIDDLNARCTWEISIKCPKVLGDALGSAKHAPSSNGLEGNLNSLNGNNASKQQSDLNDEDRALDLNVVCTGDMTYEIEDPRDATKKITSFVCTAALSVQHIGFGIGPFEHVDLAQFRESDEDDRLGQNAVPVHGYCLPGRVNEVKNTCLPIPKAIDFFTTSYGAYPFQDYKICFVDELERDVLDTGSLSICSSRLLFPEDIIEPLNRVTRQLVHALAVQWIGINIVPKDPSDSWVVVGVAFFITDLFMKKLTGNNEYRYNQKLAADKVVELDVNRPSLSDLGGVINLDASLLSFMELKAPLVLFILDRRLTKAGHSAGLSRIISRVFLNAKVGDFSNGALDAPYFMKTCEKLGHMKLDVFYTQWIEGAGCPRFRVTQRFNKKKLVVEMLIQQTQSENVKESNIESTTFMRDVKEDRHHIYAGPVQPSFTGPMTIRIHEADGTPYEHIVEIKDAKTSFEIPYNTKYKRLKRSRRQKERATIGSGMDSYGGVGDDILLYSLGDVLQSEEEVKDWRLDDWSKEDEDRMSQESYEWIRMDADFEWICKMSLQMQSYMWVSQLQQDRDVVAQLDSLQWMTLVQPHRLVSTVLIRTLMDQRYFHGIRTAAAEILAKNARDELEWIGQFHLQKAFEEFFCYTNSSMTRSNDFSNRASYNIQCAISQAIARIRNASGHAPFAVRNWLYEKLKYNDNSNNEFSDCHYLATLMRALAETLAVRTPLKDDTFDGFDDEGDDEHFHNACMEEIDRHRRIDEWIPSYHNILSTTALDCKRILAKAGILKVNPIDFLDYTPEGTSEHLRLNAFENLMQLGLHKYNAVFRWFLFVMASDPSPYVRDRMIRIFGSILGSIAIGEHLEAAEAQAAQQDGLIIEQEASTEARQRSLARKQTVEGAVKALKDEMSSSAVLKTELRNAIISRTPSLHQISELQEMWDMLFTSETSIGIVAIPYPRSLTCKKTGKGKISFTRSSHRYTLESVLRAPRPRKIKRENSNPDPAMPPPSKPPALKLKFGAPKKPTLSTNVAPAPSSVEQMPPTPGGDPQAPQKLKLKFKLGGGGGAASPPS
ncbi:Transcription initiation factor TFIID subunit 2 [Lecanora helva]